MQHKKYKILSLLLLFSVYLNAQYDKPYVDSLQTRLDTTKFDSIKIRCLIKIGMYYGNENPQKAKEYFIKAYQYKYPYSSDEQGYRALAAGNLASVENQMGNPTESYQWNMIAYKHALATNELMAKNLVYEQLSIYYRDIDRYDSSIYFCQLLINMWDAAKKPEKKAAAYYSLANLFQKLGQYTKAKDYLNRIIKECGLDEANPSGEFISIYGSLAELSFITHQYDSVVYYINKSYPIATQEQAWEDLTDQLALKAKALIFLKKYKEAETTATEGFALAQANSFKLSSITLAASMAIAKAHLNNTDSAMWYANYAETHLKATQSSKQDWVNLYNMWSSVYEAMGNYTKAYEYKQKELDAYTDFKNEELSAITAKKEIQFETAKKEEKIIELNELAAQQRKINWLIGTALVLALAGIVLAYRSYQNKKKAAMVLEQSNKEKEIFLKEIHHRVKNNLQIISSLLYMQFKDAKDDKMLAQLKQAQDRIKSMALVHNKLYETNDVVHVYLQEYIKDLAQGILSSNTPAGKEINLQINGDDKINLSLDTSISLGLILNELITNSCKYAFTNKDKGNIWVSIQQKENNYVLEVKDDGSGLPAEFERKNSLGVRLVKNLTRQLGGTVNFSNNNGTIVSLTFKDAIAA